MQPPTGTVTLTGIEWNIQYHLKISEPSKVWQMMITKHHWKSVMLKLCSVLREDEGSKVGWELLENKVPR